jgi:hypothetical protein
MINCREWSSSSSRAHLLGHIAIEPGLPRARHSITLILAVVIPGTILPPALLAVRVVHGCRPGLTPSVWDTQVVVSTVDQGTQACGTDSMRPAAKCVMAVTVGLRNLWTHMSLSASAAAHRVLARTNSCCLRS